MKIYLENVSEYKEQVIQDRVLNWKLYNGGGYSLMPNYQHFPTFKYNVGFLK